MLNNHKKNPSLKQIFSQVNKWMLIFAILPLITSVILYSQQILIYQRTITNVQNANKITASVNTRVREELWNLVSGQISVKQYEKKNIVKQLRRETNELRANTTTSEEVSILQVTSRVLDTLVDHQHEIIDNIKHDDQAYDKNKEIMVQVESVTSLLSDILQQYVGVEIKLAGKKNNELFHSLIFLSVLMFVIILIILYLSRRNRRFLKTKVEMPLDDVITMSNEISKGNFNYRLPLPPTPELSSLTLSLNTMADNLERLLEENALKQYYLAQSEVRVLQAQITPHFVYNSLDAIVSLIEQEQYDEAKRTTYALSDFFRISLSKGRDWITVATEIQHVHDYLIILKIRYGEMLDYDIDVPTDLQDNQVLKMILQPIVENAVYHGTKYIRRVGHISVRARETDQNLIFTVQDNGIGVKPDQLDAIQRELAKGLDSDFSVGYGLYNVNKRLLLYYGDAAGIKFTSAYRQGTTVILTVPKKEKDDLNV